MNRRSAIKTKLAVLGSILFFPSSIFTSEKKKTTAIIGVGKAGYNILQELKEKLFDAHYFFVRRDLPDNIWQNGEIVRENFNANAYSKVLLVSGLGGATGSAIAGKVYSSLKEKGIYVQWIAAKPFYFEGNRTARRADTVIKEHKENPDFYLYEMENVRKKFANLSIKEAFEAVDEEMIEQVLKRV